MKKNLFILNSLVLALTTVAIADAVAGTLDLYHWREMERADTHSKVLSSGLRTEFYSQWVSHDNHALGTFQQRYYIDETFSKGDNSPVFFYICGESSCEPRVLNGAIRQQAERYGAKLVALEHRYYGVSIPRPTFSAEDLQYLTTDFALRDLEHFQKSMQAAHQWTGKWITFGGSYPGSLSAYYRLRYPHLTAGSLASSAPVEARENFEEYDEHVTNVAGPQCAEKMRAATTEIEAALVDPVRLSEIKTAFGVAGMRNNQDFLFFVADIGAAAVQYGFRDRFCDMLAMFDSPLGGYAAFAQYLYSAWHIDDPMSLSVQGAESENPADYASGIGGRQWYYQSCMEYGYWQNAHHDPKKSTRSVQVNADYFQQVCQRLFGITAPANTNLINEEFYKPLMTEKASHIYFTNGSTDPWSRLSLTTENGNAINPNLNYTTISGAAHCDDLRSPKVSDSDAVKKARSNLAEYIRGWLT